MDIDLLAFTGHKGLEGPTGTGGLVLATAWTWRPSGPFLPGGTGSRSEHEEQPEYAARHASRPARPTASASPGWARACADHEPGRSDHTQARGRARRSDWSTGSRPSPASRSTDRETLDLRTATVSLRIAGSQRVGGRSAAGRWYGILCRVGLHCSPACHRTIGTFPEGTVRLAAGLETTMEEIDATLRAVEEIASEGAA